MAPQGKRALRVALGIVAAIVLVGLSGVADDWASGAGALGSALRLGEAESGDEPIESGFGQWVAGEGECASIAGELTGARAAPSWFASELFVLDGMRDVRVSESGDVFGFTAYGADDAVLDSMRSKLRVNGWVESKTGIEGCSVFMKGEGTCRWAMVSCVAVGDATSVVVRCLVSEDR